jgi:hypothetical protein
MCGSVGLSVMSQNFACTGTAACGIGFQLGVLIPEFARLMLDAPTKARYDGPVRYDVLIVGNLPVVAAHARLPHRTRAVQPLSGSPTPGQTVG